MENKRRWKEDDPHARDCAMSIIPAVECTCGKLDYLAKLAENEYQLVSGVGDVAEYTLECMDYDDAISHALSEFELSGDQVDTLDDTGYVSWTDETGTNWVRLEVIHDGVPHSMVRIAEPSRRTSFNYCPRCNDWFEPKRTGDTK